MKAGGAKAATDNSTTKRKACEKSCTMQVKLSHLQDWVNTKAWAGSSRVATLPAKALPSIRACSSARLTVDRTREIAIRHVANEELLRQKPPGSTDHCADYGERARREMVTAFHLS
jgi:hypothetical protein